MYVLQDFFHRGAFQRQVGFEDIAAIRMAAFAIGGKYFGTGFYVLGRGGAFSAVNQLTAEVVHDHKHHETQAVDCQDRFGSGTFLIPEDYGSLLGGLWYSGTQETLLGAGVIL